MNGKISKENASEYGKKGSRKGVPNKVDVKIKTAFSKLLENNLDQLQFDLNEMSPRERFDCLMKLARFVLPTASKIEFSNEPERIIWNETKTYEVGEKIE